MIMQPPPNQTTNSGTRTSLFVYVCVGVCVCSCFSLGTTAETPPHTHTSHMTISWIKALLLQLSGTFTTQEDMQKGNCDVMCSQCVSVLREEKLKLNNVLTVRLCLCTGCVGADLCPSICYDATVHCRDFQHVWQANRHDVGWKLSPTSTFDIQLHGVYLYSIKMFSRMEGKNG